MSGFSFKKWYLDAADDQGNVYIGYWVSLHWRSLTLYAYQHLWRTSQEGVKTQGGLTRQPTPFLENDKRLVWKPQNLNATWDSAAARLDQQLLKSEKGEIKWQCIQPKAKVNIELPRISFSGWGYTECIEITIPVWKLPFKTLYWGRAHSENHYLVWIKWESPTTQSLVWHNGQRGTDLIITGHQISSSDIRLKVGENTTLRQGKLISTIFQPFSKIKKLLPTRTFLADEQKWYSRGQLETKTNSEPAIIIHEKVTW